MDLTNIARSIDHTLLRPDADDKAIEKLCNEALNHHFASVCVPPYYVPLAELNLRGSDVKVCTVIGFPLGYTYNAVKRAEAEIALKQGAQELDMVINIAGFKSGQRDFVQQGIAELAGLVHGAGAILKVIIETSLLDEQEKIQLCSIVADAGADFIKTSTGFSTAGATIEDVQLMRKHSPAGLKIKASGGIRNLTWAKAMLEAGADRLGTSSGVAIMAELKDGRENKNDTSAY